MTGGELTRSELAAIYRLLRPGARFRGDEWRPDDLRGVTVYRAADDSPCPQTGVILDRAGVQGDEYVWVVWDSPTDPPPPAIRESLDELTRSSQPGRVFGDPPEQWFRDTLIKRIRVFLDEQR